MSDKVVGVGRSPYVIANRQRVSRSGDALDLTLTLSRHPIYDNEAATKLYVDDNTGGQLFGDFVIPNVVGSWYTHTMAGFPTTTGGDLDDQSIMGAMWVGRNATWDAVGVNTDGGFFGRIGLSIWRLSPTTLLPTTLLWSSITEAINSCFGADTHGYDAGDFTLSTTDDWLGLAVHSHGVGPFGLGGWVSVGRTKNDGTFGQSLFSVWGGDATLQVGAGADCLKTAAGDDGQLVQADPTKFVPTNYGPPDMGLRLLSIDE